MRASASLQRPTAWLPSDGLMLRFFQAESPPPAIMDGIPERSPAPRVGRVTQALRLADLERDTDRDGWTDLEEARLGLDAARADSDADGLPDGVDPCPNYAATLEDAAAETQEILRRSVFAVFSVGGSRTALLVEEGVERVHADGYAGPILYGVNRNAWIARHGHGGVFVTWKIVRKAPDEAVVEIVDWEGMLAGGGQDVFLRRIAGAWIVVARVTTWVS